ncbi:MAG: carbohydrate ABC transporter substrate-binding protein [Spirochaetes bacterium]|nr:MAG: carbohydrate ABC transporter substrate-binding protein [Spirochaetota bacterium]
MIKKGNLHRVFLFLLMALVISGLCFAGGKKEEKAAAPEEPKGTGKVTVMAVWGGQELEVFREMLKPFEERTGYKVEYEGTRDLDAILTTRVEAGNPPDIAGLPGPGKMAQFAAEGKLVDLSTVLDMERIKADYAQGWIDLGTVDGKLVGLFTKAAIKGLIWYRPDQKEKLGFAIPESWDQLISISKNISDKGVAPWAIGLESGAASGWVGTDWLENIFLKTHGPEKYEAWYKGEIPWTSGEVRRVWQEWGKIVADEKMIYGGKQYVLSTNFGQAHAPLFADPPQAIFHHQATFIVGFIQDQFPDLKPGENYTFFKFPYVNSKWAKSVEAAGDVFGMFNKTPEAVALMNYLSTPEAQAYWVSGTGALSPNRNVSLVFYPDEITKEAAKILKESEMVVFDASDMMPGEMNNAFWSAVMDYVENPANLDSILERLEKVRKEAY